MPHSANQRGLLEWMLRFCLPALLVVGSACVPGVAPTATIPAATVVPISTVAPSPSATQPPVSIPTSVPAVPTQTAVSAAPAGRWEVYSNANYVRGVAVLDGQLYAATEGGVAAWELSSGNVVRKWTTLDGLTHNLASSVVACPVPEMRVVVGTAKGINLYDPKANKWQLLTRASSKMASDSVAALLCDAKSGTLIIGYDSSGLDFYNAKAGTWGHVGQKEGLASDYVNAMAASADGKEVWVASPFGATLVTDKEVRVYDQKVTKLASDGVSGIAVDAAGNVWWGMFEGLVKLSKGAYKLFTDKTVAQFPFGTVTTIAPAPDGSLWLGTGFGDLCHLDAAGQKCLAMKSMPGNPVGLNGLAVDGAGQLYYASDGAGVSAYDGKGWRQFTVPGESLASNRISAMAEDKDGAIWIATDSGVNKVTMADGKAKWELITASDKGLPDNVVTALFADPKGGVWFGAGAPALLSGGKWTVLTQQQGLLLEAVTCMAADGKGRVWFGTPDGISIWDGKKFQNMTEKEGLPEVRIQALLAEGDVMWAGTANGLLRYDGKTWQRFDEKNGGLPSADVNFVVPKTGGGLWVGTSAGLAQFDGKQALIVPEVAQEIITSAAYGKDGTLWVGSTVGVYRYDGKSWQLLSTANGLPTQQIMAVLVDRSGSVWFGGDGAGVARFIP
ncbi:MAG: two-component regulator propeller domain-containing protein [Chloroflexota bacterium]|nr:two-component regulator propeller domain-containing protein [Chloroflexota bacterium]